MEVKYAVALFGVLPLAIMLAASWWAQSKINQSHNKLVNAQQDTIQKLISREPVTYKEVNVQPPKLDTDRPVAWGGVIMDREEI